MLPDWRQKTRTKNSLNNFDILLTAFLPTKGSGCCQTGDKKGIVADLLTVIKDHTKIFGLETNINHCCSALKMKTEHKMILLKKEASSIQFSFM